MLRQMPRRPDELLRKIERQPQPMIVGVEVEARDLFVGDAVDRPAPDEAGEHLGEVARQAKRSEEHTSELQSLMRTSYAVFCMKHERNNITQAQPASRLLQVE